MYYFRFVILLLLCNCSLIGWVQSQPIQPVVNKYKLIHRGYRSIYMRSDSLYIVKGLCNQYKIVIAGNDPMISKFLERRNQPTAPLLTVHGTVQYDFLYRSMMDTPYYQRDFQQYTIQTSLDIMVRDRYPIHLNLNTRQSNSPYYRDFFDINTQFDPYSYKNRLRQELKSKIDQTLEELPERKLIMNALQEQIEKYTGLKNYLSSPGVLQKMVEERERQYRLSLHKENLRAKDTLVNMPGDTSINFKRNITLPSQDAPSLTDSLSMPGTTILDTIQMLQQQLDFLKHSMADLRKKADSLEQMTKNKKDALHHQMDGAVSTRELKQIGQRNGIELPQQSEIDGLLSGFTKIGLGRSMVSYTELTAWNINLTGVNLEYNPSIYGAVAVGKVDYGFRDFLGKNIKTDGQNLYLARFGIGNKERKAIIFTVFNGRKYNYSSGLNDTVKNFVPIVGYSLETILKKNENTQLSFEIAKSTRPVTGRLSENNELHSLVQFRDQSNLGINVKANYYLSETKTSFSGFYRKTGAYFQSFSLFTYNTNQVSWQLRADQPFWKRRADVVVMLRQNDFFNPFASQTYKTTTVFKSVQMTLRMPRWPVLSAGYYPGTQLYVVDQERLRQNVYYILNGSLVYAYKLGGSRVITSLFYNRYFNQNTDSGFIAYKGINYLASHAVYMRKLQWQTNVSYTDQKELRYYTIEEGLDYAPVPRLKVGGSGKYNRLINGTVYWGSRAQVMMDIKNLGVFQLQYEKSFLPTIHSTLYGLETGRVTWFKHF